jgi:SAM-dependent methyltransferase
LLPFASESFDIIYLRLVLHHLIYPENILAESVHECFRVLKSGGLLALVEPNSWNPIGALMNAAHRLGVDTYIHGTNDDVALSPLALYKLLSRFSSAISTHVVSYNWRRLPISVQLRIDQLQSLLSNLSAKVPYFGHSLMMVARKQ